MEFYSEHLGDVNYVGQCTGGIQDTETLLNV